MKVPETIGDQQLETLVGAAAFVPADVLQGDRPLLLPGPPVHPGPPSPNQSLPEKAEKVADQGGTKAQGSFREIFYFFETRGEKVLLFLAVFLSAAQGVGMPIFSFILGSMTETFSDSNPENIGKDMNQQLYIMIGLAAATLVVAFLASSIWSYLAGKQASRIKTVYFRKLLYQRTSWYDKRPVDQIAANFQDQVSSLTAIFSDKIHMFFMCLATVSGGILVAFIKGWLLTLYILALCPLAFGCLGFFIYAVRKREQVSRESYGEAGAITDECFTFLKTIKSLSGEEHEIARYERSIAKSRDESIRYSWQYSLGWGLFWGSMLVVYGLAFLIGSRLISHRVYNHNWNRDYNSGDMVTIFFCIVMGVVSLGQLGPVLKSISSAQAAVGAILAIIRNEETETHGTFRPPRIVGDIIFDNVSFAYPSNPQVKVIKNLSLRILPGQKIALVGPSGCGKSTFIGLLQRYYDPTEGRILLDGVDLREYDLKFLRSRTGLVCQQPMLFAENIRFNVTLGSPVLPTDDKAIWDSLELAEAKSFVERLPKQLDEFVGSMGSQLAGGQKQRVAIARALIRKPDMFIFDEATSALDRTNEAEIQKTIDDVAVGITAVTIAHRLTTIKDSDVIFVMKKGKLVEQGSHESLMAIEGGVYHNLVKFQITANSYTETPEKEVSLVLEDRSAPLGNLGGSRGDLRKQDNESLSHSGIILVGDPKRFAEERASKRAVLAHRFNSIFDFLGPEKWLTAVGLGAAMFQGSVLPIFGFLLGGLIQNLVKFDCLFDPSKQVADTQICFGSSFESTMTDIDRLVGGFVGVAVGAVISTFTQFAAFAILSERFTYNLRHRYFRRLMFMDLKYHDRTVNQPGALSARLATKCKKVNILVGTYLGTIMMSGFSLMVGLVISFIFSWRVALITLSLSPLILVSSWFMSKVKLGGATAESKKIDGSQIITDSINSMRVVRSLTAEETLIAKFAEYDGASKQKVMTRSIMSGVFFGLSQFLLFMIFAAVFRISARLILEENLTPEDMFKSMFPLFYGVFGVGQSSQFISDIQEVKTAAREILADMNEASFIEVDPQDPGANVNPNKGLRTPIEGQIEIRNVSFTFEGRTHRVLRGLSLKIDKGQNTAFVGSSGCGKSTIMQLLMRFYDPDSGRILIDGVDIRDYALDHLRRSFGIVRQEPSLFNGTIDYNIRYNDNTMSDQEIWRAADLANATEFIKSYSEGLHRNVGNWGEKLSGGQKQRIAIARVVAQRPKIYLFDEATSSLDSQNEEAVQKAIERIGRSTTSLTIAHRLGTIRHCDLIFVMEFGHLIEKGTFDQLLAKKGKFAELARG